MAVRFKQSEDGVGRKQVGLAGFIHILAEGSEKWASACGVAGLATPDEVPARLALSMHFASRYEEVARWGGFAGK